MDVGVRWHCHVFLLKHHLANTVWCGVGVGLAMFMLSFASWPIISLLVMPMCSQPFSNCSLLGGPLYLVDNG